VRSRIGQSGDSPQSFAHRAMRITVKAMLVASVAACTAASGVPSPTVPTSSPERTPGTLTPSPSASPTPVPASADPTSLRWVEGAMPGVAAATDPTVDQEFYVLGWSKGYLGFTSTIVKATGKRQGLLVTSSADGLHWSGAGRLDPGGDDGAIIVTQLVEGPSGLLLTAEPAGCSLHKSAVRMWRSTDGAAWTSVDIRSVFGADALPGVSGGSAGYIVLAASGNGRTVWTSQDGAAWHRSALPSGGFSPQSVASFQRGFIMAGRTQVVPPDCGATQTGSVRRYAGSVWSSQHGSAWAAASLPNVLADTETTMSVRRLNDETVLAEEVATDGSGQADTVQQRAWTSSDGLTWRQNDALVAPGYLLTDGTRTMFARWTAQGQTEIWTLTRDLRLANLSAGTDVPIAAQDGQVALGPAGLVVTDSSGATSWLAVPVP
jgi:hypothetical protein